MRRALFVFSADLAVEQHGIGGPFKPARYCSVPRAFAICKVYTTFCSYAMCLYFFHLALI